MAKRILAARHYAKPDSMQRKLVAATKPAIRKELREALAHLGDIVPRAAAIERVRHADWRGLKDAIPFGHFREVLKAPFGRIVKLRHAAAEISTRKINGAFVRAGRRVRFRKGLPMGPDPVDMLPVDTIIHALRSVGWAGGEPAVEKAVGDRFNFDLYDDGTQQRIREAQDALIVELDAGARETIDTIIMNGARLGLSAEEVVDDIRADISLTARQAQAVMNYEDLLRDLDPAALERQLRNTAYDDELIDAIDSGADLSDVAIARMVDAYRDNYLDYRAETIAETESTRAVNAGLQDAYAQAIDRGALPADAVKQYWLLGDKPCPVCESIPPANEDGRAVGEAFDSIDGPQDAPPVHPNCNCDLEFVTDLDKVPDEETEQAA